MTKIKCPKCNTINPEGQAACTRCQSPLPRVRTAPQPPTPGGGSDAQVLFRPGQVVASRYTVLGLIGRGGMGCIYRVRDNVLKEDVALKTLLPQLVRDRMVVERFFNEARIARGLSHPNIVRVHDIGMTGGIVYISMELVKGKSLRAMLEALPPGQRLPIDTTVHIIDELCAALEYAHRHTIHRDIKPENVMVGDDGSVKLMDFGISKLMDTTRMTATSIVMGTPFYMSPEQQRNSAGVDARADIYSVGVLLYEVLTGNVPTGIAKPASQIAGETPPALDPIVAKCVEPDPADRFQTVSELRAALQPIKAMLDSGSSLSYLTASAPSAVRGAREGRVRKAVGAALVFALLALTGLGLYRLEQVHKTQGDAPGPGAPGAPSVAAPAAAGSEWERLENLVPRVRARAAAVAEDKESMLRLLAEGDSRWQQAQKEAGSGSPDAPRTARHALQCYFAVVKAPLLEGMVFVPPGDVTLRDGAASSVASLDGFFIDAKEVTIGQYLQFQASANWVFPRCQLFAPQDHPVTCVTFYDAQAYAAWAGKKLPTEAQWARAAYGGPSASPYFPWGNTWENGASNTAGGEDGYELTAPPGSLERDRTWAGCYDMAGNVAEWTRSAYQPLPYDPADGREDPDRLSFGVPVVVRGGSFQSGQANLFDRSYLWFEAFTETVGFRCVWEAPNNLDGIESALGYMATGDAD